MTLVKQTPWNKEQWEEYNDFRWVKNTKCERKRRFEGLTHALRVNLGDDSRRVSEYLGKTGQSRSLLAPYLCPHCGFYHNGGRYHPLNFYRMLVVCSHPAENRLTLKGFGPLGGRSKSIWNKRIDASADGDAHTILVNGGYAQKNPPTATTTLYWIESIILPAEATVAWFLKEKEPLISCFLLDPYSTKPIDLFQYS